MRYPNPTPAPRAGHDQARQAWRRPQRQGHARTFPFPNPEAKTASADGTAPARVWESRTPPPAHHKEGGPATGPPLFFPVRTPATPPHRPHRTGPHKATVPHGHARTGPHGHTHPHAHGHTGHSEHPPHPDPKNHTHGHTHKHSMSTQVDAVGYETCV